MNKLFLVAAFIMTCGAHALFAAAPATQPGLTGRVVDPAGKPIAGATVELAGPVFARSTTDAQGNFSFNVRTAGEYRLGARATGFITIEYYRTRENIQLSAQSQAKRDLVMQPGATVRVRVVDLLGVPVQDVSVDLTRSSDDYRDRILERKSTDPAGRTSFTVPASRDPYVIIASREGDEPTHGTVTAATLDKPQEVELSLLPGTPVKGVAICNDGKPATGWSIVAYPEWWVSNYIPRGAKIDDKGNFTLTEVGPGKYNLWLSMNRTSRQVSSVNFPPTSQAIRVDIPLPSPAGRVQFSGKVKLIGAPRPDYVSVEAMSLGGGREWFNAQINFTARPRRASSGPAPASAPSDGTFTFDQIPAGTYRLSFNAPTIENKVLENVTIPGDLPVIELKVVGTSRLAGTVTDAATGKPIPQFGFRVKKVETVGNGPNYVQEGNWSQVNKLDGTFSVDLVGPGVYQVQASADGYAWLWSDKVRVASSGAVGNIAIKLTRGGGLAGIVVDPDGKPLQGAKVIPLSMARTVAMRGEDRFEGEAGAVTTDARGIFTIKNLATGDESFKVVHEKFAPRVAEGFKITDGQTADARTIKVTVGGTVEGTIFDEKGTPASAVTLNFQDQSGYGGGGDERAGRLATAVSDQQGKYRVEHLPEQPIYVVVAEGWKRGAMLRRTVRPLDGKTATLDFGGTTPLKGRLLAASQPVANSRVNLSLYNPHFGPVMYFARTDDQGRFAFMGMPAGHYTLYSESKNERGDWLNVREVDVTGEPQDIGELSADVGDVLVTITADDGDDLKAVNYVSISTDIPGRMYQTHISSLVREGGAGDRWRGKNVPVGRFRVQTHGTQNLMISEPFERKTGEKETAVKLHLPRRSGELTVRINGPSEDGGQRYSMLQTEDKRIRAYVTPDASGAKTIKLPPGRYRVMEGGTDRPREGVAPFEVKEGSPATIDVDVAKAGDDRGPRVVSLNIWDATGVLVLGPKVTLTDPAGKAAESAGDGGLGPTFNVAPGKYKAVIERPGKEPHTQEIDVPKEDERPRRGGWRVIHVVLP